MKYQWKANIGGGQILICVNYFWGYVSIYIMINYWLRSHIDLGQKLTEVKNWLRQKIDWVQRLTEVKNRLRSNIDWGQLIIMVGKVLIEAKFQILI